MLITRLESRRLLWRCHPSGRDHFRHELHPEQPRLATPLDFPVFRGHLCHDLRLLHPGLAEMVDESGKDRRGSCVLGQVP
jgi:hypothetical protein